MDRSKWDRTLTCFQASARGYLVRNEVRRAQEDFEDIVLEIDGDLTHLGWSEAIIPIPHFTDGGDTCLPHSSSTSKPLKPELDADPQGPSVMTPSTQKTEAERDDSQTQGQASLSNSRGHGGGLTERIVMDKDVRMLESTGESTPAWSSLELDINHRNSEKGSQQYLLAQEVPCSAEALRLHRNTLTMELLWLQQAIDSRKKYISLKNQLSVS